MNRKQKVAILVGATLLAGVTLFPPWVPVRSAKQIPDGPIRFRWFGAAPLVVESALRPVMIEEPVPAEETVSSGGGDGLYEQLFGEHDRILGQPPSQTRLVPGGELRPFITTTCFDTMKTGSRFPKRNLLKR